MRHILAALFILVLGTPSFSATTAQKAIAASRPAWVLAGAQVDVDFKNCRAWSKIGGLASPANFASNSNSSGGTNLLPSSSSGATFITFPGNTLRLTCGVGLLVEQTSTNFLLNSAVPITQTTGSLTTGAYTLWVNGSGSAQMSLGTGVGCGVGTATNGTPVNFTISVAGTCTVTITGSLNAFQLEKSAFGTSLIITGGVSATRQNDSVTALGQLGVIFTANPWWGYYQTNGVPAGTTPNLSKVTTSQRRTVLFSTASMQLSGSGGNLNGTLGSGTISGRVKLVAYDDNVSLGYIVANNGTVTVATTAENSGGVQPVSLGSSLGSSAFINSYLERISGANMILPSAAAKALTQ